MPELSVFLGSAEDYCFAHMNDPEKLDAVKTERQWVAEIQPVGIAVDGGSQRNIGFTIKKNPMLDRVQ